MDHEQLAVKFQTVKNLLADAAATMPGPVATAVTAFLAKELATANDYYLAKAELDAVFAIPEISECTPDHVHLIRQIRKGVVVAMTILPATE